MFQPGPRGCAVKPHPRFKRKTHMTTKGVATTACLTAIVKCVLACLYVFSALLGKIHVFMLHMSCLPYHPPVGSVLVVLRTASSNQIAYFWCVCVRTELSLWRRRQCICFIWHSGLHSKHVSVACPASSNTSWMAATLLETELIKTYIKWD